MPKLTICLPTYNEKENLPLMVEAILAVDLPQVSHGILVVDDNSPDGTGQVADELALKHPDRVSVLHRTAKEGLGKAYLHAFKVAIDQGADLILHMDCDGSHRPEDLPKLVAAIDSADLVIGSRYTKGGSVAENWPWYRKALSAFANRIYIRSILRTGINDATGGFRLWRKEALFAVDPWNRIRSSGYAFMIELTYLALRTGCRVREVPIHFPERSLGKSKMSLKIQLEAARAVLAMRWRHRKVARVSLPDVTMPATPLLPSSPATKTSEAS
ncbi:MAG: polyprenol monophosphomannose synthase [Phycisphaeraceae bacterium]